MRAIEKGAIVGAVNALAVGALAAMALAHSTGRRFGRGCGNLVDCPTFVSADGAGITLTPLDVFLVIILHGIPLGILLGLACGRIAENHADEDTIGRFTAIASIPFAASVVILISWPELVWILTMSTALSVCILARWTRSPDDFAHARALRHVKRRRRMLAGL